MQILWLSCFASLPAVAGSLSPQISSALVVSALGCSNSAVVAQNLNSQVPGHPC